MKMQLPLAALIVAAALPCAAQTTSEPGVVGTVKSVAVKVENAVERGVKAAASGVERGAQAAARGVKTGVHAAAEGIEKGAKATARAADTVADKVKP
jgi:hypothetical protein